MLVACSSDPVRVGPAPLPDAEPTPDASEPDSPVGDAGAEACTDFGMSCVPLADPCTGGTRYGCYGGGCPAGDVGACRILSQDTTTSRYTETCCERAACTRVVLVGQECTALTDGGRTAGWSCPPGVKPSGSCTVNGSPAPAQGAHAEYCCGE
jgi:hypothetical protein